MRNKSAKMMIGVSACQAGYKHVHMMNGYSFPARKIFFKYMPVERLLNSNDEIVFVSPIKWDDPFERLYYNDAYTSKGYQTKDIACLCVSENSTTNEEACWKVYAGTNSKVVRISLDIDKLMSFLDDYAERNGYEVYIGRVNYNFDKEEIYRFREPSSKYHEMFFPKEICIEHYLSLMLVKRKSFKYENEVRIFLVKEKIDFDNGLLRISCKKLNQLISKIILAPDSPDRAKGEIALLAQNNEVEETKKKLKCKFSCIIQQSQLYKLKKS